MKKIYSLLIGTVMIVIALLTIFIPIIISTIDKRNKKDYKENVKKIIDMSNKFAQEHEYDKTYVYNIEKGKIKLLFSKSEGDLEQNSKSYTGYVKVEYTKRVSAYISNKKYCAIKKYYSDDINIYDKKSKECKEGQLDSETWIVEATKYRVEINNPFDIPTPVVIGSDGNKIEIDATWTITNKTQNKIIGKDLTTVSSEYTNNLYDIFVIDYIAHDNNNTDYKSQTTIGVVDRIVPDITKFEVSSITSEYNSNYVNISLNVTDLGTKQENLKVYITTGNAIKADDEGWVNYKESFDNFKVSDTLDNQPKNILVQVKDEAGNMGGKIVEYRAYGECMNNVTETSNIDEACSKGKEQYEIYRIDNTTNKKCPVVTENCNKNQE